MRFNLWQQFRAMIRAKKVSRLGSYPRPPMDTGRGIHGPHSPNPYKFLSEWDTFWKPQMQAMGIKWIKVMDDGTGTGGKSFELIRKIIEADIMPVVRFYRQQPNPGVINGGNMDYAAQLVKIGCVYIETNNEPDLALEWKDRHRPDNWLDIVVEQYIYEASILRDMGAFCLFPAFGPGGQGEGRNPFKMIVDAGREDLFETMTVAVHNYCLARPLDFPEDDVNQRGVPLSEKEWLATAEDKYKAGPLWAWEMTAERVSFFRNEYKNPGQTILENSTCYRAYEWLDHLVQEAVGYSVPIMMTEGGYNVGQRAGTTAGDDPRYPKPSPQMCADLSVEMMQALSSGPWARDYYFANMPWLVGVQAVGNTWPPYEEQGPWYGWKFKYDFEGCNGELPVVQQLKDTPALVRQDGPTPPGWNEDHPGGGLMAWHDKYRLALLNNPGNHTPVEFGIEIVPVGVEMQEGDEYFECVGVTKIECAENNGMHHWWLEVVDEEDQRLFGSRVNWDWEGMALEEAPSPVVVDKPPNECSNLPLWKDGYFNAWASSYVKDGKDLRIHSESVRHVNANIAGGQSGCSLYHHSFYTLWKRKTYDGSPVEPPVEPPVGGDCEECYRAMQDAAIAVQGQLAIIETATKKIEQVIEAAVKMCQPVELE